MSALTRAAGGGRRLVAAGEAGSWAVSGVSGAAIVHARGRPGRAPRLPGEAAGRDAAAGAGGSRIVLRLRLAALHQA
jgi:hypothetical protein